MTSEFIKRKNLGISSLMAGVFILLTTSPVIWAKEAYTTTSEFVKDKVGQCDKSKKLLVGSYVVPKPRRYQSVAVVYECQHNQHVIEITDNVGRIIELDRFRSIEGAKIKVSILEASRKEQADFAIVTYGFEPAGDDQVFLIEVYRLEFSIKTFSIWSTLPPRVEDLNGDGVQEMVVHEDLFSINRPDAPTWPRVFELSPAIKAISLSKFQSLLADLRKNTIAAIERITKTCQAIGSTPCPLESSMAGLKKQLETVDAFRYAKGKP